MSLAQAAARCSACRGGDAGHWGHVSGGGGELRVLAHGVVPGEGEASRRNVELFSAPSATCCQARQGLWLLHRCPPPHGPLLQVESSLSLEAWLNISCQSTWRCWRGGGGQGAKHGAPRS